MLNSPVVAWHLTSMGAQLRFQSSMPDNLKELAIILVAREWNSGIEWTGHSVLAAQAGVSDQSIENIRTGQSPAGLTEQETVIASFVQQLRREKELSDENFEAAQRLLGVRGVTDLTMLVSYYTALALVQISLQPEMQPGRVSTL